MQPTGPISHIDISVGYPERSIRFYDVLLTALGFTRAKSDLPVFAGSNPTRAWWTTRYPGGAEFAIEVRPAHEDKRERRYDRYQPGPHHIAFHAESAGKVEAVYQALVEAGAEVLDPPSDYSGQPGYSDGYYAAFFADPDGLKLEVVYVPRCE